METSLHDLLEKNAMELGGMAYIREKKHGQWVSKSFAQFRRDVTAFARHLLNKGYAGHKIIIYADNSYQWIVADIALMAYVGVSVPLDKEYKKNELATIIGSSDVSAILYSAGQAEVVRAVSAEFPQIDCISLDQVFDHIMIYNTQDGAELVPKPLDAMAKIFFTSGTTGTPKGVVLSQRNMMSSWKGFYCAHYEIGDTVYLILPFHHVFAGVGVIVNSQLMQVGLIIGHDIKNMGLEMQETNPQVFDGVPIMFERFYNARGHFPDFKGIFGSAVKYLYCGGAPLSLEVKKYYLDSGLPIFETYGMTELSSLISLEAPNDPNITSVGKPFNAEVKIISPDSDGYGEIAVKGDCVFMGYYQNWEINSDVVDPAGFFHTGDIGRMDGEGYLYVRGRKARVIVTNKGKNIFPDEIEALLKKHPNILNAKVLLKNNTLCAKLLVSSSKADIGSFIEQTNNTLPHHMQINSYEIAEDAPGRLSK